MPEKEIDLTELVFRALRMAVLGAVLTLATSAIWALGVWMGLLRSSIWNAWVYALLGAAAGALSAVREIRKKMKNRMAVLVIACILFYVMTLLLAAAGEGSNIRFAASAIPTAGMLVGGVCANVTISDKRKSPVKMKRHNIRVNNRYSRR